MTQALLDLAPRVGPAPSGSRGTSASARQSDGAATTFDATLDAAVNQSNGTPANTPGSARDSTEPSRREASDRAAGETGRATETTDATDPSEATEAVGVRREFDKNKAKGRERDTGSGTGHDHGRHSRDHDDATSDHGALALVWSVAPPAQTATPGTHAASGGTAHAPATNAVGAVEDAAAGKHRSAGTVTAAATATATADIRSAATTSTVATIVQHRDPNEAADAAATPAADDKTAARASLSALSASKAAASGAAAPAAAPAVPAATATVPAASFAAATTPSSVTGRPAVSSPETAPVAQKSAPAAAPGTADQHRASQTSTAATDAASRATSPTAVHLPGTATLTHTSPVAAPAPPPPAPMAQPDLAGTLARLRTAADGSYQMRVSVHPAELGGVNVTATVSHGVLSVVLTPDQTAHHAISQALPQLRAHLADQGFVGVDVGLGSPQQGGGQPGDQGPHAHGSGHSTTPDSTTAIASIGESADGNVPSVRHRGDHTTLDRLL